MTTRCCLLETGVDGCDLVPVSLDRTRSPSRMPQIRRHRDHLGHAGTASPRTTLGTRVWWPGVGWGLEMYLASRGLRAGLGLNMCAFHDQGFGKGLRRSRRLCSGLRVWTGLWGRGCRGRPQGSRCSGACGPRSSPIVTRQVTATRVSSLKLCPQSQAPEDPRVEGPTLSGGEITPGPKLKHLTLTD